MYIRIGDKFITQRYSRKYHFNDGNIGLFDCTSVFINMFLKFSEFAEVLTVKNRCTSPYNKEINDFYVVSTTWFKYDQD